MAQILTSSHEAAEIVKNGMTIMVGGFGVFASSDRLERPDLISSPRIMVMSNATYQYFSEGELMVGKGFIPTLSPCL